jgi:hypothetical protein
MKTRLTSVMIYLLQDEHEITLSQIADDIETATGRIYPRREVSHLMARVGFERIGPVRGSSKMDTQYRRI